MVKGQKFGVLWKLLFGIAACLCFALSVLSDTSKLTKTSCPYEFSQQSTSLTSYKCEMVRLPDGIMLQTVPKVFSPNAFLAGNISGKHMICRIPECSKNLCKNGWCEETMVGYNCNCSSGFQGRHCDELITESTTEATTEPTTSPTTTMSEHPDTTTSQNTTTSKSSESSTPDGTTNPPTPPTTTTSDTTTSEETTTSKSTESSTTVAMTKPTMRPTTTLSDTVTSQEITTATYLSPTVENVGSFYTFSTAKMNQTSAVLACSQYGSHLVFIESQEEQDFIERSASEDYWIGLTVSSPGEARWLDGSRVTYSKLNTLSFDDRVNCFRIRVDRGYSWEDKHCYNELRFICEN